MRLGLFYHFSSGGIVVMRSVFAVSIVMASSFCAAHAASGLVDGNSEMKRPLLQLADGNSEMKRPLLQLADGNSEMKRPLLADGNSEMKRPLLADGNSEMKRPLAGLV
ncbi:MAG TPA: hypothetical protein VK025_14550 [Steroidobacter sp.]|nr:hypothetical protein [Steroidobacter sp.]